MKNELPRKIFVFTLGATLLACHVSRRLNEFSTYSLPLGQGPNPASLGELFLFASYIRVPCCLESCINKLRQIDGAKQHWALEHGIDPTKPIAITWADVAPYVKGGKRFWCPRGGSYRLGTLNEAPTCSVKGHALPQ